MGILRAVAGIGGAAAMLAVLAGCVPSTEPPRPATAEEKEAFARESALEWWKSFAPDTPMPEVAVIEMLPPDESGQRQIECMREAAIPGVTVSDDYGVSYEYQGGTDDPLFVAVQQQFWVCAQQYPMLDEHSGLMSESELAWLYDFYDTRYRPCLASLGFSMIGLTTREAFVGDGAGYARWIPHDFSVAPVPTRWEWSMLAERCPLPALLDELHLPGSIEFN